MLDHVSITVSDMAAADPQDLLVPTKTPPGQPATEDRRAASLDLWRLGEAMKMQLAQEKAPAGPQSATFTPGESFNGNIGLGNTYLTVGDRPFLANANADRRQVGISQIDAAILYGIPIVNANGFWSQTAINATGETFFGGVTWRGRRAMRISACNWRTTEADVARTLAAVQEIVDSVN